MASTTSPNTSQATVLYPNTDASTFDLEYYLKTHMPLVDEHWGPKGLKGWTITKYVTADGNEPKFSIAAVLTWESDAHALDALKSEAAKIVLGDIPKFSNVEPVVMLGSVIAAKGSMS
ncbi:hypothetical protein EJ05DRAFT_484742 [Pseudovirgaria hyperparasitica]|uniref:EthD domain-containing protein n=1 Tax=Pseudovirgaria hyperparasitica TaxID=470096 RepID=A0A6A6WAF6_9PEZI|nr:uncharacterized protein EJ05DRAFT_484742 [Pseudovirgaria hyperparasitica]KAF2759842.1 hypothetical protein EJ05DRAFT_484742 [Pseudovirgaria hyperparasitica]